VLSGYDERAVLAALRRCMRERRGALALCDVIERIDDGWPEPQEAWGMTPRGESDTVVWTEEIAAAYFAGRTGDRVADRMTFLEIYRTSLARARAEGRRPRWYPSYGTDPAAREGAIAAAVERGRLPTTMLPALPAGDAAREVVGQLSAAMSLPKIEEG